MATKIVTKNSSTASAVPTASDLVQGELAVNVADKRLFTEDNGGSIVELGTNPSTIDINAGTIDGTTIGASSASTGAFTTLTASGAFTSLGIDDNADATAITIDSSENVGIGITSSLEKFTVANASSGIVGRFTNNTNQTLDLGVISGSGAAGGVYYNSANSGYHAFQVGGTERMRIDSSGNLLVGTTVANPAGANSVGVGISSGSYGGFIGVTRDGNTPVEINRKTSDGNLITFRKDSSSVGSIGTKSGDLYIGTGDTALRFQDADDYIYPVSTATGTSRDNAIDLGWSGGRFQDLYLSGQAIAGDGSVTAPAFRGTDTNTGIYFPSAGVTAISRNGVEGCRMDSSGNLLVGTTDSNVYNDATGTGTVIQSNGIMQLAANNGTPLYANRQGNDGDIIDFRKDGTTVGSIGTEGGRLQIGKGASGIYFYDSGPSVLPWNIGSNTSADNSIDLGSSGGRFKDLYLSGRVVANGVTTSAHAWSSESNSTSSSAHLYFRNPNGFVGNISTSGTSTSYNTSSDYRLKENVVELTGATERLKQLNPSRFNFIADADTTVDGFLAHEVADVVPEAISGNKDAMKDEEYEVTPEVLDDEGNVITEAVMGTRSVPDYQGIDQSKLVPLLVATIQELEARITQLENN